MKLPDDYSASTKQGCFKSASAGAFPMAISVPFSSVPSPSRHELVPISTGTDMRGSHAIYVSPMTVAGSSKASYYEVDRVRSAWSFTCPRSQHTSEFPGCGLSYSPYAVHTTTDIVLQIAGISPQHSLS